MHRDVVKERLHARLPGVSVDILTDSLNSAHPWDLINGRSIARKVCGCRATRDRCSLYDST